MIQISSKSLIALRKIFAAISIGALFVVATGASVKPPPLKLELLKSSAWQEVD